MNAADFTKMFDNSIKNLRHLMITKGAEYAHGEDRFDNFKRNAAILNLNPFETWGVYFHKHIDAIDTFITDIRADIVRVRSESIIGRIDDAIVYLFLLRGMVIEAVKENEARKKSKKGV